MLSNTLYRWSTSNCVQNSLSSQNRLHLELLLVDGVEFVGLINAHGRLIESLHSKQIPFPMKKSEMLFMGISLSSSLQRDFDDEFGAVKYSMTERKNLKFLSIPCEYGLVIVLMKKSVDHGPLINKITDKKPLHKIASVS